MPTPRVPVAETAETIAPPVPPFLPGRRRWPADARARWLIRLGLAAPLVGLAVLAARGGYVSAANREAIDQAAAVVAGGPDLSGLGAAYPPVPALLATVVPGGAFGLCVVAALCAAVTLHLVWEQLLTLELPRVVVGVLLATLFASPTVAFVASQSVAAIASLALITVALQGFVRFAVSGHTEGGFVAGLAFAAAFLVSPIALFYAVAIALATLFADRDRLRAQPGVAGATIGVLLFPTAFAVGAWAFLEWRFAGTAYGTLLAAPGVFAFPGGLGPSLLAAAVLVGGALLHVPVYLAGAVVLVARRPVALVGYLLAVPGSVLAVWVGLRFTSVTVAVFATLVALTTLARRQPGWAQALLVVAGIAQVVLAWVWPAPSAGFTDWTHALLVR